MNLKSAEPSNRRRLVTYVGLESVCARRARLSRSMSISTSEESRNLVPFSGERKEEGWQEGGKRRRC